MEHPTISMCFKYKYNGIQSTERKRYTLHWLLQMNYIHVLCACYCWQNIKLYSVCNHIQPAKYKCIRLFVEYGKRVDTIETMVVYVMHCFIYLKFSVSDHPSNQEIYYLGLHTGLPKLKHILLIIMWFNRIIVNYV